MSRRQRCFSKWNKISVVDDHKLEIASFSLNELGQLEKKIKTQKRRRIHEGRRARKVPDQPKVSPPPANEEEIANFFDQIDSTFTGLQSSSENDISLDIPSSSLFDEKTDFSQSLYFHESDDVFDTIIDF